MRSVLGLCVVLLACSDRGVDEAHLARGTKISRDVEGLNPAIIDMGSSLKTPPIIDTSASERKSPIDKPRLADLNSADFSEIVSKVAQCPALSELDLNRCPHFQSVSRLLSDRDAPFGHRRFLMSSVGQRLLDHESASVRWVAVRLLQSVAQVEKSSREKLMNRLKVERTPLVIVPLMKALEHFALDDPSLKALFMALMDHQSPVIRAQAVRLLSRIDGPAEAELSDRLEQKLASDPSGEIGGVICSRLLRGDGMGGVEKVLAVVNDKSHAARAECLLALTSAWTSPSRNEPSIDALNGTIAYLKSALTDGEKVPWKVMSRVVEGGHLIAENKLSVSKINALRLVVSELIDQPEQNIQARVLGIQALHVLKADEKTFRNIIRRYENSSGVEFQLAARARFYLER